MVALNREPSGRRTTTSTLSCSEPRDYARHRSHRHGLAPQVGTPPTISDTAVADTPDAHIRPDPSYLSAIEQQINDLRADRETAQAMGAAEFVIRNLTEQIDAYGEVITKMRTKLAELPADERAEIEEASAIMRKARAGSRHLKLPITPVRHPEPLR
jgi:hypothetical protein